MPSKNPRTAPSVARYQPGARRRWVSVIGKSPEGTSSLGRSRLGCLLLPLDPGVPLILRDHPHVLAHGGVADPAQLGADHLVPADPVGGEADVRGEAGD